jgi:hypothetical protein
MTTTPYNPETHHRHSIRLKGHDYAGGGMYFVTICAHRDAGNIFAHPAVKEMVAREWESVSVGAAVGAGFMSAHMEEGGHEAREEGGHEAREEGGHEARPYVIMPDHFHALIQISSREEEGGHNAREGEGGDKPRPYGLGDAICAFKSRVVHAYIARVKAGDWPPFPGNIWHRNYYEMIVRDEEAEQNIRAYIRMNPWRCVTEFGNGLRGMGNPALWHAEKLGVLCSRNAPRPAGIPKAAAYLSGFHSPMEQEIFRKLLEHKMPVIWCPAWGLGGTQSPEAITALEENRMLILEMTARDGDLASAEARNRFVLEQADKLWLPHVTPGGMLDRLVKAASASSPTFKDKLLH